MRNQRKAVQPQAALFLKERKKEFPQFIYASVLHNLSPALKIEFAVKPVLQVSNGNPFLLHCISVPDGDTLVLFGLEVIADAERRADFIFSSVSLADGSAVIKIAHIAAGKLGVDLLRGL